MHPLTHPSTCMCPPTNSGYTFRQHDNLSPNSSFLSIMLFDCNLTTPLLSTPTNHVVLVMSGLMSGSFDYLAALREVTTMFMSWDSYDEAEHKDLLQLQKFFFAAQKVLAESAGFIRQFLVDDKGCVLIACWGVPTASHPDNARRAVCAAAMISRQLLRLGMKTSIGITTGNVFCGSVGSYVRREYAVIGDVVNLAARLMGKSDGRIFIDEPTYSRIPSFLKAHLVNTSSTTTSCRDTHILFHLSLTASTTHIV